MEIPSDGRRRSRSRCTRSASTRGADSCSSTSRPRARARCSTSSARWSTGSGATRWPSSARGATFTYDVACNWKVIAENYNECYHCAPVHPELCDLVPAFRRGGAELGWVDGIPHREGAWTFTSTGTSQRAPFEGLDDAERQRHKGELVYPNLLLSLSAEHVAAYNLQPRGPAQHARGLRPAVPPRRDRRGRRSTRPTRATSGTSSTARTGRSARACSAACRRGRGPADGSRRWRTSPPTSRGGTGVDGRGDGSTVTSPDRCASDCCRGDRARWARLGSRLLAGAPRCRRRRVRAVRARTRARRLARPLADHPSLVPHARLRRAQLPHAYDAWADVERESGESIVTRTGGVDLFPAGRHDRSVRRTRRASTPWACRTSGSTASRCVAGGRRSRTAPSSTTR